MSPIPVVRLLYFAVQLVAIVSGSRVIHLNEDNWRQLLSSEWMVEFHAPWCPACKDLAKAWSAFSELGSDLKIKVGDVDVTRCPGLSGRFLVTALPTIFHVKDGIFRQYLGPRDKEDFIKFVEDKKWTVIEPIPSWKYPDSIQMSIVAWFFRLSMTVRDFHNLLIEKYGIPSWMSYAMFGTVTLILGCILGFIIVYVIDHVFPTKPIPSSPKKDSSKKDKKKKPQKEAERKPASGKEEKFSDRSEAESTSNNEEEPAKTTDDKVRRRTGKASSPRQE